MTDDILYSTIGGLSELLKARKISSVELTKAYLDRLEKLGPRYNALAALTRKIALRQAKDADDDFKRQRIRSPLHGIPYGAKDLLATRGIPTTWGAAPYRERIIDEDATVIRKLRAAGAVLAAKLSMVELAGGFGYNWADASFTGPGRTPWNTDYWSGGSSSGPGAAVAAGLVPFAIGSETSGSIITPAAYCGVSGLRPTYGRVSRHGAMALSWTLDKLGPMCRSADCCGLVLAAIAGKDTRDPSSAAKPFAWPDQQPGFSEKPGFSPRGKKYRIGVLKGSTTGVQAAVKENFEAALKVLADFAEIETDVPLPDLPFGAVVGTVIQAEGASAFRDLIEGGRLKELRRAEDKLSAYAGLVLPAVDYLQAMRLRGRMKREMDALYAKYDALVAPSRGTVAYPIDKDFDKAYPGTGGGGTVVIPAGNLVGQPALSVPNGFGLKGLPTGVQFTGRAWGEARLLSLAHAYQQATAWHRKRPPI